MIQYFQLTPEILLEYVYNGDPKLNEDGVDGNEKDLYSDDSKTMLLTSNVFSTKYLCFKDPENNRLDGFSNLVLPLNNSETQFVVAKSKYQNFFSRANVSNIFSSENGSELIYEDTNYDEHINKSCDVKYDKCILHFTSRNYFGIYDSLIFQAYVYMSNKSKLYFASFLFRKTSNLKLKSEHMLYNEKLYTTQIEFDIPSVASIFTVDNVDFNMALESKGVKLLNNTPIGINVYGVSESKTGIVNNYEKLKTHKLTSISIPYIYNRLDEIRVNISEADDGDYYYIDPEMGNRYSSFVDYIESMGEDIRAYMVMHELCLKEVWVDENNTTHSEITHKEFHIIDINEDDENEEISKRFDAKIKYRPICTKSGNGHIAIIIDTIKIINTVDSSSYEVTGSLEISNPHKYGKRLKRLDIKNDSRPIVNVFNKNISSNNSNSKSGSTFRKISGKISGTIKGTIENGLGSANGTVSGNIPGLGLVKGTINSNISGDNYGDIGGDIEISISASSIGLTSASTETGYSDNNGVIVLNKSGGFVVENMSQNITSFMESTNIGVSIVELSPEDVY